jgi:prepilin peptidase CpaA
MLHTWSSLLSTGLIFLSIGLLLAASLHDIIARTVPNWTALSLAALGCALRALDGNLTGGLLAGLLVFVVAALCWRRHWLGGGDVKLIAAAAITVPPSTVIPFIVAVSLAGSVLALLYLIGRRLVRAPAHERPHSLIGRALRVERWRIRRGGPLPYACAIAAGGLFTLIPYACAIGAGGMFLVRQAS